MPYTAPQFNCLADIWFGNRVPFDGPPDEVNVPCQFYIPSRASLDHTPGTAELFVPPIYVRMPVSENENWKRAHVLEIHEDEHLYYLARWKERMHLGFPNEYRVILVVQCHGTGEPCPMFIAHGIVANGNPEVQVEITCSGSGVVTTPESANGTGSTTIEVESVMTGSGTVS